MGGENLTSPQLDEETLVTVADERLDTPETPELPPALDIKLDTLLESTGLEDTSGLDFAISKSLEEALESGHDATALISVVEQIDPQQVVELLADIDDPSAVPDRVTMSNLLSGDPNSPAAQFILENLAKQCASGAFITMQSTSRGPDKEAEQRRRGKIDMATTLALASTMDDIRSSAFINYQNATNDEQRLTIFTQAVEDQVDAWKAQNPNATPEQEDFIRETVKEATAVDMFNKFAQQYAAGELTHDEYKEQIGVLVGQLEPGSEAHAIITSLVDTQDNLVQAQEALAAAEALAAQGDHNAHVVDHYRYEIEQLRIENEQALQQLQELRDRLVENADYVTDLSLEELDALIASKEVEISQMSELEAQIAGLTAETKQVGADLQQIDADIAETRVDLATAEMERFSDELDLGRLMTDHNALANDTGATISMRFFGDTLEVDGSHLPGQGAVAGAFAALLEDTHFTAGLDDTAKFAVVAAEDGRAFIMGIDGERRYLTEVEMSFVNGDVRSVAELAEGTLTTLAHSAVALAEGRDALEGSIDEENRIKAELQGLEALANAKGEELRNIWDRREDLVEDIDRAREEGSPNLAALEASLAELDTEYNAAYDTYNNITTQANSWVSTLGAPLTVTDEADITLHNAFEYDTDFSIVPTDTISLDTITTADPFGLNDPYSLTDPYSLSYDFGLDDWDFGTIDFGADDWSTLSTLSTDLTSLDFTNLETSVSDLESDLAAELQAIQTQILTDAGVPPELHEAFIKDMEHAMLSGTCALNTNMKQQLGIPDFDPANMDVSRLMMGDDTRSEAQMTYDQMVFIAEGFAFTEEGQRYAEIHERLRELQGVTREEAIEAVAAPSPEATAAATTSLVASVTSLGSETLRGLKNWMGMGNDERVSAFNGVSLGGEDATANFTVTAAGADEVAADNLTLDAPTLEETTRKAALANEARNYADAVRANGVVTSRDLEDAFPGLSDADMDIVIAEMEAEGITIQPDELEVADAQPKPTEDDPELVANNTGPVYEHNNTSGAAAPALV